MFALPSFPFTATPLQATTYLLGVCLFSITFLVFLNSSVSFVITDLLGIRHGVGNFSGTLGFADELVALAACPLWGVISDRLGVRWVVVAGYAIVGVALCVFVQARNVYPELLLARLLFSLGGAACSTMVTAVLPTMTTPPSSSTPHSLRHRPSQSLSSELTITPARVVRRTLSSQPSTPGERSLASAPRLAGLVGMFTGCGALVALVVFLPLPARLQSIGLSAAQAITDSYYIAGIIAIVVAVVCSIGLRNLNGEESKGFRALVGLGRYDSSSSKSLLPYHRLLLDSVILGFKDVNIGLGYLGGFVARTSSVGVSLFIPLFVNAYFISSGRCKGSPDEGGEEMRRQCRQAYVLAAELTGISQLVALISAPIFGYISDRYRRYNLPLLTSALLGIVGYTAFAALRSPIPTGHDGHPGVFVLVAFIGISQIGAIVCSLGILGRGILGEAMIPEQPEPADSIYTQSQTPGPLDSAPQTTTEQPGEGTSLLGKLNKEEISRSHLKGSIAGVYSLLGGAGILLLTKLGGVLFDKLSPGAPFYMLAIFNAILFVVGVGCAVGEEVSRRVKHGSEVPS